MEIVVPIAEAVMVVHAEAVPGCAEIEWQDFSYGDAEATLVKASSLVREMESRDIGNLLLYRTLQSLGTTLVMFEG